MCVENALCNASRLKEGKAEYHGIGGYAENGTVQKACYRYEGYFTTGDGGKRLCNRSY